MARPKSLIDRKNINTSLDIKIIKLLKKMSLETGIPINRLIEDALKSKYLKNE